MSKRSEPLLYRKLRFKDIVQMFLLFMIVTFFVFGMSTVTSGIEAEGKEEAKAKTLYDFRISEDLEFSIWKATNAVVAMEEGRQMAEAGLAPKTEEESKELSFTVAVNDGAGSHEETHYYSSAEMDQRKWAYVIGTITARAEENRMIWRIDTYFAHRGSPMQGTGAIFVRESKRTGIPSALGAAISEAESSCGKANFAPYNYWGGMGYPGGFSNWDESTVTLYNFLVNYFGCPQTMYQCPGYCEGNGTMGNVDRIQKYIESMDANHIN